MGLPSSTELRTLAAHLASGVPITDALSLAQSKRYELIHELAGFHDAVQSIQHIADRLEEVERDALQATSAEL